ncbi:hypothetical protein Salat_2094100 [Sesamum alatum]|uniref:Uncharacterized protein n=1 Tax=Sesamum alatum TaxID=300844 RepID=A0AAE1Y0G1_9LAMI|nr:hypothetical protein Salat_2094100 [Sesamum alatum]
MKELLQIRSYRIRCYNLFSACHVYALLPYLTLESLLSSPYQSSGFHSALLLISRVASAPDSSESSPRGRESSSDYLGGVNSTIQSSKSKDVSKFSETRGKALN